MRKIRNLVAGGLIAGALVAGAVTSPVAASAASAAAPAAKVAVQAGPKHFFKFYSGFDKGRRSLFEGYWYKKDGWYYVFGDLFDRDFDREYSYLWIKYEDRFGRFHFKRFKTFGKFHYENKFFKARHFWVGVSEGRNFGDDFSSYRRLW
ncbi:hypothetical protein AB0K60_34300 [Thermopolyspora sp. NPDC052614]|uniref:hypothetical protein n=1 Tax=Thermopolyspora sp. NPDC052614 TaxID=3155682 RepID=UPI0034214B69